MPDQNTAGSAGESIQITDGVDTADVIDACTYSGLAVVILDSAGDPLYTIPISNAGLTELAAAINSNRVDVTAAGDVANDIADSGNPVKIGGTANSSAPTSVTAGDRVNLWAGLQGQMIVGLPLGGAGNDATNAGFFTDAGGNSRSLNMLVYNGSTFDRMRGDATNGTLVNLGSNNDVSLNAGTNAIGKLAANSGVDIGDVDVTSSVSSTLDHGSNLDVDTAAEQITSTSFAAKFGVVLRADPTNTGILYIGNSDVTAGTTAATDGYPLEAGDSIALPVTNSNLLYAIASAANQKIYWVAV